MSKLTDDQIKEILTRIQDHFDKGQNVSITAMDDVAKYGTSIRECVFIDCKEPVITLVPHFNVYVRPKLKWWKLWLA